MSNTLKIFVRSLQDGHVQKIQEALPCDFLNICEQELSFSPTLSIQGETYLANEHLVIKLEALLEAHLPCAVCNEIAKIPLHIKDFMHIEPINELPSLIFNYSALLREAILLAVPQFTECNGGHCPERRTVENYLKKPKKISKEDNFPFSNLNSY